MYKIYKKLYIQIKFGFILSTNLNPKNLLLVHIQIQLLDCQNITITMLLIQNILKMYTYKVLFYLLTNINTLYTNKLKMYSSKTECKA